MTRPIRPARPRLARWKRRHLAALLQRRPEVQGLIPVADVLDEGVRWGA